MKASKNHEITIIMGDGNAKVGREATEHATGHYGLEVHNERGNDL